MRTPQEIRKDSNVAVHSSPTMRELAIVRLAVQEAVEDITSMGRPEDGVGLDVVDVDQIREHFKKAGY